MATLPPMAGMPQMAPSMPMGAGSFIAPNFGTGFGATYGTPTYGASYAQPTYSAAPVTTAAPVATSPVPAATSPIPAGGSVQAAPATTTYAAPATYAPTYGQASYAAPSFGGFTGGFGGFGM